MRLIVLDTNIIISAFFWKGHPRDIYDLAKDEKIILLYSKKLEAELIRVLSYSKFGLTPSEIFPIVNNLRKHVQFIEAKSKIEIIKKDPTDNIFLKCAMDGKADYILSGDHHLLNIDSFKGIPIITAKDFLIREGFIR